jgi:hypothetical protein
MTTTALNPASAKTRNSPGNPEFTLADKSGTNDAGGSEPPGNDWAKFHAQRCAPSIAQNDRQTMGSRSMDA